MFTETLSKASCNHALHAITYKHMLDQRRTGSSLFFASIKMARFAPETIEKHIRRKHPGCPDFAVRYFIGEITHKEWKHATIGKVVGITMQNVLRHSMTNYDQMLLEGIEREEARRRVQPKINAIIAAWQRELTETTP